MRNLPNILKAKIESRIQNNALRQLTSEANLIDFASNDYLGFSKSEQIFNDTHQYLLDNAFVENGATGSRLLSGNHNLYTITENFISTFHQAESALIFNSGYDANVGFFSSVPQKGDLILYDELCHASIRDGIQLSYAKAYRFNHNDFEDLEKLILRFNENEIVLNDVEGQLKTQNSKLKNIYIVTESVFSMDGDTPNLEELIDLSEKHNCYLVLDEAHALGVFGDPETSGGQGLVQEFGIQDKVFARIMTFGKGLGCHGAAILGSKELKQYLVNFARSFIYTTGLSPHSVATILIAYQNLEKENKDIMLLRENIIHFNQQKNLLGLKPIFVRSKSSIQSVIIPGNEKVKRIAKQLQEKGFDVKAILSPTVPEGQERLRFCLHAFNTKDEISEVLQLLSAFVFGLK